MDETKGGSGQGAGLGCPVALCPICTLVTLTGQARPEVVEHLLKAGQELVMAIKAVLDARAEGFPAPSGRVERIEVD